MALPAAGAFVPRAVAIDRHGRIVIAGYLCEPRPGGDGTCLSEGDSSFRLARLTPDGGLDPEFGVNGFVTTPLGDGRSQALDVVVDAKGRLVAAGVARRGGRDVFALARYLPDGSLDQSFGAGGTALVAAGSAFASLGDVERGPRGTLLATGQAVDADGRGRMVIARFTNAGALDGLFGTGGLTFAPSAFGYGLGLAVTRAGRPLAAGVSGDSEEPRTFRFGIQRTTPAGAPDAAFAGDGFLEVGVGRSSSFANAAVPVPGGGALAAGAGTVAGGHQAMAALRTTPDGRVDLAFGSGGGTLVALGDGAVANDLVLDQAQRALLIGQSAHGAGYRFAVVRLGRDGRREAGFAATGISWRDYPVARATAGALQGRDRLVTVGLGCSGGATANCRGGTPVLLVARIEVGPPEPIRIDRLARQVTRRRLRQGLRVHFRLLHRGVPESWLVGRRRGSRRRVTLAHGRAPRAGTRFTWRLHVRRQALVHTRNGRLRVVIRSGRARAIRTLRLTG